MKRKSRATGGPVSKRRVLGAVEMWYILETFDKNTDFSGKKILALTPEACYMLDERGIKYHIPEEFYEEKDLIRLSDTYFHDQLIWFRDFDAFLRKNIRLCGLYEIDIAKAHYYQLSILIDSLVVYSHILKKFLDKANPERVEYIAASADDGGDRCIYDLHLEGKRLVRDIALRLFKAKCVPSEIIYIKGGTGRGNAFGKNLEAFNRAVKNALIRLKGKSIYNYLKYKKFKRILGETREKDTNVLILNAGIPSMDHIISYFIGNAGNVFLKEGRHIKLINGFSDKEYLDLEGPLVFSESGENSAGRGIAGLLSGEDPLVGWINERCGIDVSGIVLPYLKDFVEKICVQDIREIIKISDFLKKENIDFVIARSSSERGSVSSLLAAGKNKVKRVCFQHGCSPLDWRAWHITEIDLMDIYFAADTEAEKYFRQCAEREYVSKCDVFQSPHYLENIRKVKPGGKRRSVMYVPYRLFFGFRSLGNFHPPITWYYRLQKSIVDLFGERKDCDFIFKMAHGQDWAEDSIVRYIRGKKYPNVFIERADFYRCLNKADMVISDYPSSPLYEAASAGLPVLSLCPDIYKEWPGAAISFGKSFQKFSTITEAVSRIRAFMNEDPETYKARVSLKRSDPLECLIKSGRRIRG
ncbi:MAG: hypothetical protein ABIA77_01855 [Candidatus Omnitrophota bacterium]